MLTKSQYLSRFILYESRRGFWIVGHTLSHSEYRILQLVPDPDNPLRFTVEELPQCLSQPEFVTWLAQQKQTARAADDDFVQKAPPAWGLLGLIRFTACYYLCIVTKCSVVAMLGGNQIFHIEETKLVPLMHSSQYLVPDRRSAEARLASTFHSLDLAKTFYFSPTYDLTNTLQTNLSGMQDEGEQSVSPTENGSAEYDAATGNGPSSGNTEHAQTTSHPDTQSNLLTKDVSNNQDFSKQAHIDNGPNQASTSNVPNQASTNSVPNSDASTGNRKHSPKPGKVHSNQPQGFARTARDSAGIFVWNSYLLQPLQAGGPAQVSDEVRHTWFLQIVHGFIDQARISVFGNNVYITLIARRSHQFAGARFYKRGVNNQGYPANEVETEQIVSNQLDSQFSDRYTSYVQHRGSICVSWSQMPNNMSPQPPIRIDAVDPYYEAAAKHFDRMFARYGFPVRVLNLVKTREKRPRESALSREFEACIRYLNQFLPQSRDTITTELASRRRGFTPIDPRYQTSNTKPSGRGLALSGGVIEYTHWDMSRAAKSQSSVVMDYLGTYSNETLKTTSIFHAGHSIQQGVCRTNCIDCLDRTNAAQSVIAKYALGYQLHALGIIDRPKVDYDTDVIDLLTEMYHDHGDTLALQYGGSNLVNTVETYRRINQWSSHSRDLIESIRRFYSNSFMDAQRQDAINVFLGNYQYTEGTNLWDLSTDYYLHNSAINEVKRSYRQWYEPRHLYPPVELSKPELLKKIVFQKRTPPELDTDGNWLAYSNPSSLTSLHQLFMAKINSTDKYSKQLSPFEVNDGKHSKVRRKDPASQAVAKQVEPAEPKAALAPIDHLELLYTRYLGVRGSAIMGEDDTPPRSPRPDTLYTNYFGAELSPRVVEQPEPTTFPAVEIPNSQTLYEQYVA